MKQSFVIKNDFLLLALLFHQHLILIFIFTDVEIGTFKEKMFSTFKYCAIDYLYEVGCYWIITYLLSTMI